MGRRGRRPIAERRVRSPGVVFHPPLLNHDLRLLQRVKDLPVQAFIPHLSVEALAVAVLPWTAWFDVQRVRSNLPQPLPQFLGHEFGTIVGANMLWDSSPDHYIGQSLDDLIAPQASCYPNRQAFPCVF